jgi:hypothetical protein
VWVAVTSLAFTHSIVSRRAFGREFDGPSESGAGESFGPPDSEGGGRQLPFHLPWEQASKRRGYSPISEAPAIYSKAIGKSFVVLRREGDQVEGGGCTATVVSVCPAWAVTTRCKSGFNLERRE